jgi:iron complex outermembrane receptor protein
VPLAAGAQASGSGEKDKEQGKTALAEVLVTAERYGATVQTTPVAVSAIDTTELEQRQITNVLQASNQVPGIVITPATGTSNSARIVLRGAGQEQSGINFDPAVGIYIDNVYQPRINGAFFDFFDIAGLEVLRGPQGTLYGRNTSGGALKIQSKRPSFDWTGAAEVAAGNYEAVEARGYVSGPIVDGKLAFSLSGAYRVRDGFIYGTYYGKNIGDLDRRAGRAKLLWTPNEDWDVQLSVYGQEDVSDPGVGVPLQVGAGVVDPLATGRNRDLTVTEVFGPFGQALWNNGASLNATYSASPNLQFNSITGYGNLRIHGTGSILWITAAAQQTGNGALNLGAGGDGRTSVEFFSQEFNTTYTGERLKGVAGVFYFDESGEAHAYQGTLNDQYRDTKAWAIFAQGTYDVGHDVGVTLGARYTHEDADFTQFYPQQYPTPQSGSKSFSGVSPKVAFNWQPTEDILTYLSWTKGFKSGGFNPVPPATNTGGQGVGKPTPYDEETVDSYELGVKYQSPDRSVRANLAIFEAKYDGLQLPVFFPGTSNSYTSNASKATIKGIELEPTWQATEGLRLYGNMAWLTGKYTQAFVCSGSDTVFRDCSGNKIKGLIPQKYVVGFNYQPRFNITGQFRITGEWTHTGDYFNNVANSIDLVQTESSDLFNASIGYTTDDNRWDAVVECRNVANLHYVVAGLQLASAVRPAVTGYINDPRVVMVRLRANF